ncbi:N-acetyl-D-glucosamine kinase [subsurface metagenome]
MNLNKDKRTVLTLDAGGTNFVFTAIQANQEIAEPVILPSNADDLDKCISTISEGFNAVMSRLKEKSVAISFAFPGPGDYSTGVIGDLNNLPAFRDGVPLGPILKARFNLPVFINNDGDLYAYGEALSGFLPYVNNLLKEAGVSKQYHNLLGLTLGTGFGGGIVRNEELILGDNSTAGEVWLLRNRINPSTNAEEGISIRAIKRVYAAQCCIEDAEAPDPKDIFEIAMKKKEGNEKAAIEAFRQLGVVLGDVLGNLITVFDGVAVIGGGLSGAMPLIFPAMINEIESEYKNYTGKRYPRLVQKLYNMNDSNSKASFLKWREKTLLVPETNEQIKYSSEARIPVGTSQIGTSRAISLGAYAFALKSIENR